MSVEAERGVIVGPDITYDGRTLRFNTAYLDPVELRRWTLYWDKIDWPANNLIYIASGADVQLLQREGILTRSDIRFSGPMDAGAGYVLCQLEVLRARLRENPGGWALAQSGPSVIIPAEAGPGRASDLRFLR